MTAADSRRVRGLARYGWIVVAVAVAAALLPAFGVSPADADGAAGHEAPELSGVRAGENFPVAPAPTTREEAVGRVAGGIGINPDDPDHITAFTWNNHAEPGETCEAHVSRDGGASWSTSTFDAPEGFGTEAEGERGFCSNERGGNRHSSRGHMEFGSGDTVYTAFNSVREGRLGNSLLVARSDDGGDTWNTPVEAIEGGTTEPVPEDPSSLFPRVGVVPGGGVDGADRLFVSGRGSVVTPEGEVLGAEIPVAVSDDGGQTWSDPIAINRVDQGDAADAPEHQGILQSEFVTDPDGDTYVAWRTRGRPDGQVRIARTSDGGETWSAHDVVDVRGYEDSYNFTEDPSPHLLSAYPRLAVDDNTGDLYVVYHQDPPLPDASGSGGDVSASDHWFDSRAGVHVTKSTDEGQSWGASVKVNDETPAADGNEFHQTRTPTIGVSPSGRVDVMWMDRRHWTEGHASDEDGGQEPARLNPDGVNVCVNSHSSCTEARTGDIYYAFSDDGGASFSTDKRVTDYSSNNEVGWEFNIGPFWFHGMDLDHAGDDVVAAWSDSRRGQARPGVTWTAADSESECPPDCQVQGGTTAPETNDLFLSRVSHGNDPEASRRSESHPADSAADLSATLSQQLGYPGGPQGRLTASRLTSPFSQAVVVNEGDWASALVGSVLARRYMGPVLATPADGLPPSVSDEIDRMELFKHEQADPANPDLENADDLVHRALGGAFILGDTSAVSSGVQTDLEGRDIDVARFDQAREEMAAAVARHLDDRWDSEIADSVPAFSGVVVVNPDDADSASASVLAANRRLPVLFVGQDSIPAATQSALDDLDIDQTLVVGDSDAVSDTVLGGLPGGQRVSGEDGPATSVALAHESDHRGLPANVVYVVGDDPMHAALAGSPVARAGGLLVQNAGADPDAAMTSIAGLGLDDSVDKVVRFGGDIAAPVWPDGASLTISDVTDTSVVLSWPEASDDGEVTGYHVYQDGSLVADLDGSPAPTSHTVTGLAPDTEYAFTVQAHDGEGNESSDGPSQTVTTLAEGGEVPTVACPEGEVPEAGFTDQASIPEAHRGNVDCAAFREIVSGFADGSYGPTLRVRRDQMASFIARLLNEAGVDLPAASDQGFGDIDGNVHAEGINQLAELGVVLGTSDTTYSPGTLVRRDQMASFLLRAAELGSGADLASQTQAFDDVGSGNVHFANVNGASEAGLAAGFGDGTYRPGLGVRRDQMGTFVIRLYTGLVEDTIGS